jgi:Zn-dependent peptidase ImmA (M78 family)
MRSLWIRRARREARALVRRLGITEPDHIRIEAIARRMKARVEETRIDGAEAQLVRVGDDVRILVSDRIDPWQRRFAIAHELGHYLLGHPSMPPFQLRSGTPSKHTSDDERDFEAEANAFASELLMPHVLVNGWCQASPVSLETAWRIAREFNMSILAAAIRFTELSPERCAAVFCSRRHVAWVAPSETFTREIERGRRLERDSIAWDFYERGSLDDRAQPVPADAWFHTAADVDIIEHATASAEFGTVLSMLWIPENAAVRLGMAA